MKKIEPSEKIYLSNSRVPKAGRGIFASKSLKKDEIIELCPIVLLKGEGIKLRKSELYNYYFLWDKQPDAAIALGFGSIYNHSYNPNATYKKHLKDEIVEFIAIKKIKKDEEITINYNYGDPDNKGTLWIRKIPPAKDSKL
jgi:SET domain-containing protein